MTSDLDSRAKAVLAEYGEVPAAERGEWLRSRCGGDAALFDAVERLAADNLKPTVVAAGLPSALDQHQTAATQVALVRVCPKCGARYEASQRICPVDGEVLTDDPEAFVGSVFDGIYRIERLLGRGGMGAVYLARHILLRDLVAIKILPRSLSDSTEWLQRFVREGRAARQLKHPNAVTVLELRVAADGTTYMVQEYVPGETLRAVLKRRGSFALDAALEVLAPIGSVLDVAHAQGVVHRDLKPENVMIGVDEDGAPFVKVLDLGIAKLREGATGEKAIATALTLPGQTVGTPYYMSPEQWGETPRDGGLEIDGRADVYSLGIIAYEIVGGGLPFRGRTIHEVQKEHLHRTPRPLHSFLVGIPPAVSAVVARALAKDRADRYATAGDFIGALKAAAAEAGVGNAQVAESPSQTDATTGAGTYRVTHWASQRTLARTSNPDLPGLDRFVGRKGPLDELKRRLEWAMAGECQLVVVSGEPGVGKSRLLDEAQRMAIASGARVFRGRFQETDRAYAFQGFADAIAASLRAAPSVFDSDRVDLGDLAADLASVFPALTELLEARQGVTLSTGLATLSRRSEDRTYIFELIARTFVRLAANKALVLLFEDLHAADLSVEAIEYLVRRLGSTPALLVCTYRDRDVDRSHPLARLIDALRGDHRFVAIPLEGLTEAELRLFVETALGSPDVSPALIDRLFDATKGNPYFTKELLRTLVETRTLRRDESGIWALPGEAELGAERLPGSVQQAIEERLEHLPAAELEVLGIAAVLGRAFDYDLLEQVVGNADEVERCVENLVGGGFLVEDHDARADRLAFSSGLLREVLYARLSRRRRKALHRRSAEKLEARHTRRIQRVLPQLVYHYAACDEAQRVVECATRLARLSMDMCSPEAAARAVRTALEHLGEIEGETGLQEGELRTTLARALRWVGDADGALAECDQALRAFDRAGADSASLQAALLAAEVAWEGRKMSRTRQWVERGVEVARRLGDAPALHRLLTLGATVANLRGEKDEASRYLAEADSLALPDTSSQDALAYTTSRQTGRMVLRIPMPIGVELHSLDPATIRSEVQIEAVSTIFETLMRSAAGAQTVPWLAEHASSLEFGAAYRFRLRRGVRFHDGREVTANDVRASFERLLRHPDSEFRWNLAAIRGAGPLLARRATSLEGFEVHSDYEFTIHLDAPLAFFLTLLTDPATSIVPATAGTFNDHWRRGTVGTGPFRVTRFVAGQRLEVEANPDYWREGFPRSDGLAFEFGLRPDEMVAQFKAGSFALAWSLLADDAEALARDADYAGRYRQVPELSTHFVVFNRHVGPFADDRLRRGLAARLDVDTLVRRGAGRRAVVARGLFPPGLLGHEAQRAASRGAERWVPDAEITVKALLLPVYEAGNLARLRQELVAAMAQCGINVNVVELDPTARQRAIDAGEVDLFFAGWNADYPDADSFAYGALHSRHGYFGRLCGSAELDSLIEAARIETRPDLRHNLYCEIEDVIREQALLVPLLHRQASRFARPEVEGLELNFSSPYVSYEKLWTRR